MVSPLSQFFSNSVTAHAESSSSSSDPQLQAALEFFRGLDIGVQTIDDMKKVQVLDLRPTWIDQDGQRRMVTSYDEYARSTARFKTEDLQHFVYLENLHTLNVSWNAIGTTGTDYLSKLTNLQSLDAKWNCIGAKGAQHLSKLINLQSLNLSCNILESTGVQHLSQLTNLQSLDLSTNDINFRAIVHLLNLTKLQSLDLSENGIGAEGVGPLEKIAMHGHLVDLKGVSCLICPDGFNLQELLNENLMNRSLLGQLLLDLV